MRLMPQKRRVLFSDNSERKDSNLIQKTHQGVRAKVGILLGDVMLWATETRP